jgi:hypothetical protein
MRPCRLGLWDRYPLKPDRPGRPVVCNAVSLNFDAPEYFVSRIKSGVCESERGRSRRCKQVLAALGQRRGEGQPSLATIERGQEAQGGRKPAPPKRVGFEGLPPVEDRYRIQFHYTWTIYPSEHR